MPRTSGFDFISPSLTQTRNCPRHANKVAEFATYFAKRNTRLLFARSEVHGGRCVVPMLLWLRHIV